MISFQNIILEQEINSDGFITQFSTTGQSYFSPPHVALGNVLNTPQLKESEDSVTDESFRLTNERANNGFSPAEYTLQQFNIADY